MGRNRLPAAEIGKKSSAAGGARIFPGRRPGSLGREEREVAVRVRLLLALLAKVDPRDLVLVDGAGDLLLLDDRPGMHQPVDDSDPSSFTDADWRFLRALRIR